VIHRNRLAALVFTALWIPTVLVSVALFSMGDCADPIEPCVAAKRSAGFPLLAIGLACWLLLIGYF